MSETVPSAAAAVVKFFRPLKWNEVVREGDFIADGKNGFESWVGPAGFRADTFVKQVYRQQTRRSAAPKPPA